MLSGMFRIASVVWLAAVPLAAHHAFTAEFDIDKPVKLDGVVTKVEWMNPHAWLYLDVTDEQGVLEHWQFEFGAPVELVRRGWHRQDLKAGDRVSIEGFLAKYQERTGNARSIVFPDGRRVFNGTVQGSAAGPGAAQ